MVVRAKASERPFADFKVGLDGRRAKGVCGQAAALS
jgi:hypothetical protein